MLAGYWTTSVGYGYSSKIMGNGDVIPFCLSQTKSVKLLYGTSYARPQRASGCPSLRTIRPYAAPMAWFVIPATEQPWPEDVIKTELVWLGILA